jgi:hypothetical protein
MAELRADDLHAYACPDNCLSTVTLDELSGALEARAAGIAVEDRGAWGRHVSSSGEPVQLFPQDLGSRDRRLRLRGTVFAA